MVLEDTQHRIIPQISSSESDNDEFDCPRPIYPWSQFRSKICSWYSYTQCGNLIFLLLRFYVKLVLRILEMQNLPFLQFQRF